MSIQKWQLRQDESFVPPGLDHGYTNYLTYPDCPITVFSDNGLALAVRVADAICHLIVDA